MDTKFNLYDVFGIFIPGSVLCIAAYLSLIGFGALQPIKVNWSGSLILVPIAYATGMVIHQFARKLISEESIAQKLIENRTARPLLENGHFSVRVSGEFPESIKANLREAIIQTFGLNSLDSENSRTVAFNLCYYYVIQNGKGVYTENFNAQYALCRSMILVTVIAGILALVYSAVHGFGWPLCWEIVAIVVLMGALVKGFWLGQKSLVRQFAVSVYRSFYTAYCDKAVQVGAAPPRRTQLFGADEVGESVVDRAVPVQGSPQAATRIGALELRNRWVMAPMVTLFPEAADRPTDAHIEFYARRAQGGLGLTIIGATYVSPEGRGFPNQMGIDRDDKIPAFGRLADAVQRHAPAIVQLFHAGPKTCRKVSGCEAVAACGGRAVSAKYDASRQLTGSQIDDLIECFALAAKRLGQAGFRGAELHGANGYLLHSFTDRETNHRSDEWGQAEALPVELVRGLRAQVPHDFLIGYTLSPFSIRGSEVATIDSLYAFGQLARHLVAAGVDYIHVYRGKSEPQNAGPPESFAGFLRQEEVNVPIIEGSGIRSTKCAGAFLRGGATLVAVGRMLLSYPDALLRPNWECPEEDLVRLSTSRGLQEAFEAEYANLVRPLRSSSA